MKKTRYTEEEIAYAQWKVEVGIPVAEVVRKMRVIEQTLYRRWRQHAGVGVEDIPRLKQF